MNSYKDLEVWKKGRGLVKKIYQVTSRFPAGEQYGLVSQMRRAAVSIPANLAEGNARAFKKEYIHFVSIAFGSATELETLLLLASDLEFISSDQFKELNDEIGSVLRMLNKLIQSLRNPSP
ncbi:MAG: four helix bundle protein [Proteobacteria bacterium]|nr:four helix bundle protein [Pseudomonadota bacterium]